MIYRNTVQRNKILYALKSTDAHPTASWIYDRVREEIPNVSLGTVYRNLSVLVEQGEIQKISCGEAEDRYDANTSPHIHFYCTSCGKVSDIHDMQAFKALEELVCSIKEDINTYSLICYGTCQSCIKRTKN